MRWYKHDPARFLEGVIGLTPEERGAYITIIDLLYARAPLGKVTDDLVIAAMAIDPRMWRRLKRQLLVKGKIQETSDGLMANGVMSTVTSFVGTTTVAAQLRVRRLKKQELTLIGNVHRLQKEEE